MIDLSQHGYSHDKVLDTLQSAWGLKNTQYRVDVLQGGTVLGTLDYQSCSLECNGQGEVKYYSRITCDKIELDFRSVMLQPVMYYERNGKTFEFPFPPLIPITVKEKISAGASLLDIEAYDETIKIQENSVGEVVHFPRGTVYTAAVDQLLRAAGFTKINLESSGLSMESEREDWEESDYILTIVNQLLEEIGYMSLAVDRDGVLYSRKYQEPNASLAKIHYAAGKDSVIGFSKQIENDGYKLPNRFIGTVYTSDMQEPWRYERTVTDPSYPSSYTNLGYLITEVTKYDNIASYEVLRDNVHRRALEAMASYEYATLQTAIMPHHDVWEVMTVESEGVNGLYEEPSWNIDNFGPGGWMAHRLRKVVYA